MCHRVIDDTKNQVHFPQRSSNLRGGLHPMAHSPPPPAGGSGIPPTKTRTPRPSGGRCAGRIGLGGFQAAKGAIWDHLLGTGRAARSSRVLMLRASDLGRRGRRGGADRAAMGVWGFKRIPLASWITGRPVCSIGFEQGVLAPKSYIYV